MSSTESVNLEAIRAAAVRIETYIHRTPLWGSQQLSALFDCELSLKCENLQKVGAFKARGAHNAVFRLADREAQKGVATHSSGNHGAALALAAKNRGISAHVVLPSNASAMKKAAVAGYGAQIIECEPTLAARESMLALVQNRTGAHVVHPYADPDVICGQGTVGLEIVAQSLDEPLEMLLVPVGGGGLLAGVAVAIKALLPGCAVIGTEPAGADDAYRSFHSGQWQPQTNPQTLADGLLTSLGQLNFELIQQHVDDVVTVSEEAIIRAMRLIFTRSKLVVEPSAAVTLAAVLEDPTRFRKARVGLVLSGGNVDPDSLPWPAP